jgi:hypothetical protein
MNAAEPKCKEGQVYNPATKKCVSAKGAVGKKLLAKKTPQVVVAQKVCKDDEIYNPVSKRCVKKSGKIGQRLLLANAVHPPEVHFEQTIYLTNDKKEVVIFVEGSLTGKKQIIANRVLKRYDTLQQLEEELNKILTKYLDSKYRVHSVLGDDIEKLQKIIDNILTCKKLKENVKKLHPKIDPSTCENQSTLIMMDPITTVSKKKLVKLADNYCFDIDELMGALFATNKANNPFTANSIPLSELYRLTFHPGLDAETREKLKQLILHTEAMSHAIINLYQKDAAKFKEFFKILVGAALVCTSDYTNDFAPSQKILAKLSEVISQYDEQDVAVIMGLKSKRNNNLASIMSNYANTCIHGVGYKLSDIVFNQYTILLKLGIDVSTCIPKYVMQLDEKRFVVMYCYTQGNSEISINYYDTELGGEGDYVRLGYYSKRGGDYVFDSLGAWGFYERAKATEVFNECKEKVDLDVFISQKIMKELSETLSKDKKSKSK